MFAALGRFSVRHRFAIILGWVALAVVAATLLPSVSSVERGSNSQFLPASSPSARATVLAAPFQSDTTSQATFVAATSDGRPLTVGDDATIARAESAMRRMPKVTGLVDLGPSPNGRARTALVEVDVRTSHGGKEVTTAVSELRAAFASAAVAAPAGLAMHLTGALAQSADELSQSNHIQTLTEVLSILFIVVLLLITFRALLAPVIALLPSIVALFVAGPAVALSSHIGVQVSDLTPILLTVLMLGAGTDYGLFLIFRLREELRRGRTVHDGVAVALCKVGESITFSGFTVMAALAAVVVSAFGLYQGLGPALAVGIVVALAANLTLLPALLAVFGGATFWPRTPVPGPLRHGTWGRIAARVVARPVATLLIGIVIFGGLSLTMFAYAPTGFGDQAAANSDSARGQSLLVADYPSAQSNPTSVLFRLPTSVWADPTVLDRIEADLQRTGQFRQVEGPLDFNGHSVTPADLAAAHTGLAAWAAADLPLQPPPGTTISPLVYDAYRSTAQTISPDGRTLQYETELVAGRAHAPAAASAMPAVRTAVAGVGQSIGAQASGVNGYAATAADVGSISTSDLMHIVPIVLLVLALLLAIVLRSLIAPLYLVASVGLSYLASLGLCVLVFQLVKGESGINFVLPFFMFIFILALGQDYNILVMTRIREEAQRAPLRTAVSRAVEATGTTVTSAGLILAGTFGVLTATGDTQVQEIGLGLAAGILLDTFFVRTLLVPSVVVLLGRWNWWPSALARHGGLPSADDDLEVELPHSQPGGVLVPGAGTPVLSPAARSEPLRP